MKRTYLIDSENINDVWVEILDALEIGDCIMVFFTDKSAHMGYDRIVRLMELEKGTVKWIRCFGGQNALDFQLVTELGHQICQDQECEYVIVSNDTGYDSVVRYWQQRGCSVSRMKGMECTKLASRMKKQRQEEPGISIFLKKKTFGEVTPEAVNLEVVSSENSEKAVSEKIVSEQGDFENAVSENGFSKDQISESEAIAETASSGFEEKQSVQVQPAQMNTQEDTQKSLQKNAQKNVQKSAVANFVKEIVDEAKKSVSASVEIGNEEKSENLESESDACDGAESEKPNRRKRRRGKSSAVLAKTLFDKVATPERKAQVESLTDTAKTALGVVLETASEMIAEQIAEKNSEKNSEKNTEKNSENIKIALSLTDEWEKVCDTPLITGVTVAQKSVIEENTAAFDDFLDEYQASVDFVNENTDEAAELIGGYDIVKAPVAKKALPYCNITLLRGEDMRSAVSGYWNVLFEADPKAVGGTLPDDGAFYMEMINE